MMAFPVETATPLQNAVMTFVARARTTFQAVTRLAAMGHNADAIGLSRVVVELDIDLAFVLLEDSEQRMIRLRDFVFVTFRRRARALGRQNAQLPREDFSRLLEGYRTVAPQYGDSLRSWTPEPIGVRAGLADRQTEFGVAYSVGSGMLHPGTELLDSATRTNDDGTKRWHVGPDEVGDSLPIRLASNSILRLYASVVDPKACALPQFLPRIEELLSEVTLRDPTVRRSR